MAQRKPAKGHVLSTEDRRKGAARANQVKRERGKSVRQRLAEIAQQRAEEIAEVFLEAMAAKTVVVGKDGEEYVAADHATRVRAAQAFMAEAFGRPPQALTGPGGGSLFGDAELESVRERFAARVVDLASRREARDAAGGSE